MNQSMEILLKKYHQKEVEVFTEKEIIKGLLVGSTFDFSKISNCAEKIYIFQPSVIGFITVEISRIKNVRLLNCNCADNNND